MRLSLLLVTLLCLLPAIAEAQVAYDANNILPGTLPAYPLDSEPSIDGEDREWDAIPWIYTHFNDRDFTEIDNGVDPIPARLDFSARYKVAWVDGVSKFFFYR